MSSLGRDPEHRPRADGNGVQRQRASKETVSKVTQTSVKPSEPASVVGIWRVLAAPGQVARLCAAVQLGPGELVELLFAGSGCPQIRTQSD